MRRSADERREMREEPRGIAGTNAAHLAGMHSVTQAGLAAYIGRSVQGVWNVVHGRSEPTHATASAIAVGCAAAPDFLAARARDAPRRLPCPRA